MLATASIGLWLASTFLLGSIVGTHDGDPVSHGLYGLIGTTLAIVISWIFIRSEKGSFSNYGLRWRMLSLRNFLVGNLLGFFLLGSMVAILLLFTYVKFEWTNHSWPRQVWLSYLSMIPLVLMEEIVFRGYAFVKLYRRIGFLYAQLFMAVLFVLYHVVQGWEWQIALAGPGVWSLVFGWITWRTKGIAVAIGLHLALNVGQKLFGMRNEVEGSLFRLFGQTPPEITESAISQTEWVGVICQLSVGLIFLFLTISASKRS